MPLHALLMNHLFTLINVFKCTRNRKHSRVLVTQAEYLSLLNDCIVVPTLGEAKDLIEMERIERDLLGF